VTRYFALLEMLFLVVRLLSWERNRLSLWHYRTQTHIEVDFILENRLGQITGIEVKASATVERKDFKGLRHLQETEVEIFQRGIVLYTGREIVPFGKDLWAIPLSVWWARMGGGATSNRSSD
jgi:predicted AAA+ superfamily ATPase